MAISLSNPRQKVQRKQQSSRLLALKTAFDKEEEVNDDDDDEWDPLQVTWNVGGEEWTTA